MEVVEMESIKVVMVLCENSSFYIRLLYHFLWNDEYMLPSAWLEVRQLAKAGTR
jgi:hypothetical protein